MSHNVLLNTFLCKWPESLITQYKQLEFVFKTCPFFERLDPILQAVKKVNFCSLFFQGPGWCMGLLRGDWMWKNTGRGKNELIFFFEAKCNFYLLYCFKLGNQIHHWQKLSLLVKQNPSPSPCADFVWDQLLNWSATEICIVKLATEKCASQFLCDKRF